MATKILVSVWTLYIFHLKALHLTKSRFSSPRRVFFLYLKSMCAFCSDWESRRGCIRDEPRHQTQQSVWNYQLVANVEQDDLTWHNHRMHTLRPTVPPWANVDTGCYIYRLHVTQTLDCVHCLALLVLVLNQPQNLFSSQLMRHSPKHTKKHMLTVNLMVYLAHVWHLSLQKA